ncbi:hypothetical protein KKB99_08365 [bacterium]|nr:hypothetical protein [bacterium]MBU1026004.1 hypothetical protein [bacterium]
MTSETRLQIASSLRNGADDISKKWADVVMHLYDADTSREELARNSKVAIEILSDLLNGEDFKSYSNFFRKLSLEWITLGGTIDDLRSLKGEFLKLCENRLSFLDAEDEPGEMIQELDSFLEQELWVNFATDYLQIFEAQVNENLSNLPDTNESLKQLLDLSGQLGNLIESGDWDRILYLMREIFISIDSGVVFLNVHGKLQLKGVLGFEDFLLAKNLSDIDCSFYSQFSNRKEIKVVNSSNLDDPNDLVFFRRKMKGSQVEKEYPAQMLVLPLFSGDFKIGLICLYGFNKSRFFCDDELNLLNILRSNLHNSLAWSKTIFNLRENRKDNDFLIALQKKLTGKNDTESLSCAFLESLKEHLSDIRSVIYLSDLDSGKLLPLASLDTLLEPGKSELSSLYIFALERNSPIFLGSLKDNPILEGILPPPELVQPDYAGALGIIPLTAGNEIVGIWGFSLPEFSELDEDKRHFLTLAANILTYSLKDILAIEQIKEQHEIRGREINLAASLQQHLVPRYSRNNGYEIEINLIAGGDLAGDFAFLESSKDNDTVIAIGDVSGRGIAAGKTAGTH